jgi:hypothetical protein
MRLNYDVYDWRFLARILDENSVRLSRTRSGVSDTSTNREAKRKLLLEGDALKARSAANERRAQQWLFDGRHDPPPRSAGEVLQLLWRLADTVNDGLLPTADKLRRWDSRPDPAAPPRVAPDELPEALEAYAEVVWRRWPELAGDPVPLASWAEWELNGGTLHPFYDGCGRISRAFGALLLVRGSWLLPLYEDRDTYFGQGHRGERAFADYVRARVGACARWLTPAPSPAEMEGTPPYS